MVNFCGLGLNQRLPAGVVVSLPCLNFSQQFSLLRELSVLNEITNFIVDENVYIADTLAGCQEYSEDTRGKA